MHVGWGELAFLGSLCGLAADITQGALGCRGWTAPQGLLGAGALDIQVQVQQPSSKVTWDRCAGVSGQCLHFTTPWGHGSQLEPGGQS